MKFAEYLDFMLVFTVGLQVTWERLRQLGDSPVGRDGHTLRLVQSELGRVFCQGLLQLGVAVKCAQHLCC